MKTATTRQPPNAAFKRFESLAKKIVSVPKVEADKKQAEYLKQNGRQKKSGKR